MIWNAYDIIEETKEECFHEVLDEVVYQFVHGQPEPIALRGEAELTRWLAKRVIDELDLRLIDLDLLKESVTDIIGDETTPTPTWWPREVSHPSIILMNSLHLADLETQDVAKAMAETRTCASGETLPRHCVIITTTERM